MGQNDNKPIAATEFVPLDASGGRTSTPIRGWHLVLGALGITAVLVLLFLFSARAVIFRLQPEDASLSVAGLRFHIGDNFLLLAGSHSVAASAAGYYPLQQEITVGDEASQEIEITLQPLPGNLYVNSSLDEIQVAIDGEPAGTVPGTLQNISRGAHKVEFSKYRYFPQQHAIDIEGLGKTQEFKVEMEPAWGQMQFSSEPSGANLYIDNQLIGQTPLTAEVLETGSELRLSAPGYKNWDERVSVSAGSEVTHELIKLQVADGILALSSSPGGATVNIDNQFRGTTPLQVLLSPLAEHRIEFFLEGYLKATRNASVEAEKESSLAVELKPNIGRIQLSVQPADAEILIDGHSAGTGNRTLSLPARKHRLTVKKPGFDTKILEILPRPGHQQALSVSLLTVQQAYWASRPAQIRSPVGSTLLLFRPSAMFRMGAPRREPGRRANEIERSVRLERPFYLAAQETTNGEFRRWKEEHNSSALRGNTLDMDDQPVASVTWQDAALFCNALSKREGLPQFYKVENGLVSGFNWDASGYRLPTEAEWAWAAKIDRNGKRMMFPWGNDLYPPSQVTGNYADQSAAKLITFTLSNYNDNYPVAATVGSFKPNHNGLYDLDGNVAEWVNDYYDVTPTRGEPELDPRGPLEGGTRHVIRGASWALASRSELRLSYREPGENGRLDVGFRIARYVDSAEAAP